MEKIKVMELFCGYGGASFGLLKSGIPFECVGISEIDKYAIQCYNQNFPGIKNYGDIKKINPDELPDFDLMTGGYPCQDVSLAGNRDLSKGRTNLYLEILRIAKEKKPKFMLLENVKGLLSMEVDERKLHLKTVNDLKKIGYGVCWKVLNSKDYGIPQNRERVWFVCKYGGWDFMEFQFPNPIPLKIFLKDILEKNVDKKYYLTQRRLEHQQERLEKGWNLQRYDENDKTIGCIHSGYYKMSQQQPYIIQDLNQKTRDLDVALDIAQNMANNSQKPVQIDLMHLKNGEIRPLSSYIPQDLDVHRCLQSGEPKEVLVEPQILDVYNNKIKEDGVCPTLSDPKHNNLRLVEPKIIKHKLETESKFHSSHECFDENGICGTVHCQEGGTTKIKVLQNMKIRKLTPKECFRLQGFLEDEINLDNLSDSQLYKLAGNGWNLHPTIEIFKQMFKEKK
jgi:DNA (cytosine-5)-methyltransferase 1